MKRAFIALLLTICFCPVTFAQEAEDAKSQRLLEKAFKNGNELQTQITVNGNVHAEAVLIPYVDARRIFGDEIAKNYAVIEVNVGNKSQDAALILHGVFIDYRQWPLSGATRDEMNASRSTENYQASSFPNQVATEEYRVVRGQLLDAQTDTTRNRFIRWLTLAGNLAGAYTFSINEKGIVKGIAAATGVGIPGIAAAWPDKTIEQLNRVSDFGFRSNRVIPRQGSEVIVCFFPIDRFLTPGFRKIFLKSPALFFAPLQMLEDESIERDVNAALGKLIENFGFTTSQLRSGLPCYMKITHGGRTSPGYDYCLDYFGLETVKDPRTGEELTPLRFQVKRDPNDKDKPNPCDVEKFKVFMGIEFLSGVSLNRVVITIDGVMSVDVNTIAARIDEVEIGKVAKCGDAGSECFWTDITAEGGVRKGIIHGSYLTGGTVALAEQQALQITDLKTIPEESTDQELHFSFKLGLPVSSQTKLHFTVSKPQPASASANGKPLESNAFEYLVAYSPAATGIDSISLSGNTLTVKGRGFDPTMVVSLQSETGEERQIPTAGVTSVTRNKFDVAVPADLKPGCWDVQVKAGGLSSNHSDKFAVEPSPALDSAVRTDTFIVVTGTDLVDFSHCGDQKISFKFLPDPPSGGPVPDAVPLTVLNWNNGKPVLSTPPGTAKAQTLKGKVQVFLNGTLVATNGEVELK